MHLDRFVHQRMDVRVQLPNLLNFVRNVLDHAGRRRAVAGLARRVGRIVLASVLPPKVLQLETAQDVRLQQSKALVPVIPQARFTPKVPRTTTAGSQVKVIVATFRPVVTLRPVALG
uniref:(northern house mosquito) hypothetical protein n=1 Tax=Culex pipiens TaxID=7175 RepID=A0A8D8GJR1_CULPI